MNHDNYTDRYISDILADVKSFAMVGASANTNRPSYFAMKYMLSKGFEVIPVNPRLAGEEILGQAVYASLAEVNRGVDVIDIFRNSEAAGDVVQEVLSLQETLTPKVIWMQLGVRHDEAALAAEAAGIMVVMNRCPKIEYGRLSGEIGWAGVNTGVVSSVRPVLAAGQVQNHVIGKRR